jgi:MFS transporter, DHA1 family, tetracycline resistance protein
MADTEKRKQIYPILLVNFVGTLGFSIVLPFLVFLVRDFGGNAIVYGILGATYSAFQLIGAPILGKWSDTYGRKKVLLLSNAGTLIGWIFFVFALYSPVQKSNLDLALGGFVLSLPLLLIFLARAVDGITGGNISVANAYLADISTEENRSRNFGKMAMSSNLGFILGPAIAGILGGTAYGVILPVLVALLLSMLTLMVIGLKLKEFKRPSPSPEILVPEEGSIRKVFAQECKDCYEIEISGKVKFLDIFKLKYIPYLLVLYFLIFLGFNIYYASFPAHAANDLNWSISQLGIYYAILSGIMVFVQGPVLSKALKKFSEEKLVITGSIILGTNFILLISNNIILVYSAVVLFAVGNGLMWPSFMSILSKRAGTTMQGSVQGVAGSFGGLASIIGLILGGFLYTLLGSITFIVSAGVIFAVSVISFHLLKMKPSN